VRQLAGSLIAVTLILPPADMIVSPSTFTVPGSGRGRIEAQQMGVGLDRAEIVDRDDFDVLAAGFDDGAQDVAADAAEAVDGNLDSHLLSSR
jgi:hypothetical protein